MSMAGKKTDSRPAVPATFQKAQIADALRDLPGWRSSRGALRRRFVFPDFKSGLAFVVKVGAAAEKANHHPDVVLRYSSVDIALSTHDAGGITSNDVTLAATVSVIFDRRKWA